MNTVFKVACATAFLFAATPALAQDATVGLDGPMRQVFAAPAVAGWNATDMIRRSPTGDAGHDTTRLQPPCHCYSV